MLEVKLIREAVQGFCEPLAQQCKIRMHDDAVGEVHGCVKPRRDCAPEAFCVEVCQESGYRLADALAEPLKIERG